MDTINPVLLNQASSSIMLGYRLVSHPTLSRQQGFKDEPLSWKERWLSLRPWKATKKVPNIVPSDEVLIDNQFKVIYAHPEVIKIIQESYKRKLEEMGRHESFPYRL